VALAGEADAALDRRVRACDRLTQLAAQHKTRIKDLVRQLIPDTPLTGDLGAADLAVLRRSADPRALLAAGPARLTRVIEKASPNQQGRDRAERWRAAAAGAVELYAGWPAMPFTDLAAEVASEVRLLEAVTAELAGHVTHREHAYRWVDPGQLARSLPGLAAVGGPAAVAITGDPTRFPTAKHFKSFTGLVPRASETGETDRKGQPMSKAGSALLRTTLVRAADTARKQNPQLAKIYYTQIVERGAGHTKALCVVAAALAERLWAVLRRGMPYVVCDTDTTPVDPDQAKQIIAEHWTVPLQARARRRSTKTKIIEGGAGKAPQGVRAGHLRPDARGVGKRGDLPHHRSSREDRPSRKPA
jgi:transposase